jgi:hypothetical protein
LAAAAGGDQCGRGPAAQTEQRQPAQGFASRQQAVDVVGGNLFGDVLL